MDAYQPETLIELVRRHECIYNSKLSTSKTRPLKDKAWQEIAQSIGMSADKCEKKWRNLRDTFRKVHKELLVEETRTNSTFSKKKKRWYLLDSLSFLAGCDLDDVHETTSNTTEHAVKTEWSDQRQTGGESDPEYAMASEHCLDPLKSTERPERNGATLDWRDEDFPCEVRMGASTEGKREGESWCDSPTLPSKDGAAAGGGRTGHKRRRRRESSTSGDSDAGGDSSKAYDENKHFCMSLVGPMNRLSHKRLAKFKLAVYKFLATDDDTI